MPSWFRSKRGGREDDIDRELRSHLELEREEQQERGLSSSEARYAAQRTLGNSTLLKEDLRAFSRSARLETLLQDLGYAFRLFRRAPGFTALVLLTLTLGIGANTAVFSILNGVLLQPLPYKNSNRLVAIWDRQIHEKGTSKIFDLYTTTIIGKETPASSKT